MNRRELAILALGCILIRPARAAGRRPELDRSLLAAAACGNAERCRELLRAGASVAARDEHGLTPLMRLCGFPHEDEAVDRPAVEARVECARVLIAARSDVNARTPEGGSALMAAAASKGAGNELIRLLLKSGAKVHLADRQSQTALIFACGAYGDPEAVRILLAAGADLRGRDWEGHTPLWRATSARRTDIVEVLLRAGARE